ncbi:hypothetical protein AVEN_143817-1 [Araneus ventricosus]|uniref:Uncharacterized protein n=1 Tax=Araneus ventricosus TaxID=182803 RepID=A0A4Y2PLC7_ARAVE|nr:hypothetical protein AVEN_143817-1 [Araneus ventricosus]
MASVKKGHSPQGQGFSGPALSFFFWVGGPSECYVNKVVKTVKGPFFPADPGSSRSWWGVVFLFSVNKERRGCIAYLTKGEKKTEVNSNFSYLYIAFLVLNTDSLRRIAE